MPFENLVFRPQSRGGQIPQPQPQPQALAVAVAVAGGEFGPRGIEVEKQGFRTAWLIKGQKFP